MIDRELSETYQKRVQELERAVLELQAKIARVDREKAIYSAKSRLYSDQLERSHRRELAQETLVAELVERQHELNIMLNRSNVMLARAHEATAMLSLEFGELARALPEPAAFDAEAPAGGQIGDRLQRINNLFKKTGSLSEEIAQTLNKNANLDGESKGVSAADSSDTEPQAGATTQQARPVATRAPEPSAPAVPEKAEATAEPPPEPLLAAEAQQETPEETPAPEPAAAEVKTPPASSPAPAAPEPVAAVTEEIKPPESEMPRPEIEPQVAPVAAREASPEPSASAKVTPGARLAEADSAQPVLPEQQGPRPGKAHRPVESPGESRELFTRPRATPAAAIQKTVPEERALDDVLDAVIEEIEESSRKRDEKPSSLMGRIRDMLFR